MFPVTATVQVRGKVMGCEKGKRSGAEWVQYILYIVREQYEVDGRIVESNVPSHRSNLGQREGGVMRVRSEAGRAEYM